MILGVKKTGAKRELDLVGGILATVLVLLLVLLVAAQIGLARQSWRWRLSAVDRLEGAHLEAGFSRGRDLPSAVRLW